MKKLLFLIIISTIITTQAYVTYDKKTVPPLPPPTGNVVNVNTASEFKSAINNATPGQTILLSAGTYDISSMEPVTVRTDNIAIRGATGDPTEVIIQGRGFESCTNVDEEMLMLFNANITIADLSITESRCHGLKIESNNVDSLLLHNVRFINIGERCIKGGSAYNPEDAIIRYCHFEDTKVPASDRCGAHFSGDYIGGMDVMNASGWKVHDCVFRNIKGANGGGRGGIFFWRGCRDMTVERNSFISCDVCIAFGNPSGSSDVTGGIIRNNFIVKGAYIGMEICHGTNIKIYNNTVYSTSPTYFRTISFFECAGGNEFKQNIVFGRFWEKDGTVPDTAGNIWKSASGDENTDWFVNPSGGDLHLTDKATGALNTGNSLVTDDWDGHQRPKSPDIGADEYNSISYSKPPLRSDGNAISFNVFPNPLKSRITFGFWLPKGQSVELKIHDLQGTLIAEPVNRIMAPGYRNIRWNAAGLNSGFYLATLKLESRTVSRKFFILK
jgi:hypothetical protein